MFLILFFVFLACLFIVYALYLFTSRKSDARRRLLNERLAEAIRMSAHSTDVDVQLAREELLSEIPWVNRSLIKLELSGSIKRMIDQADLQITVMRLVLFSFTAAALGFLAASMITISLPLKILFALIAGALDRQAEEAHEAVSPVAARCARSDGSRTLRRSRVY
jgi:tight adherence protein B